MSVAAKLEIPGNPVGVAVTPDGAKVFVTSSEGKTLSVIDAAQRKLIKTIPLKGGPFGVAVHPSGSPVYVTDWFEHRVLVVSPGKGGIEAEVSVGNSPSGIAVRPMARPSSPPTGTATGSASSTRKPGRQGQRQDRLAPVRRHHRRCHASRVLGECGQQFRNRCRSRLGQRAGRGENRRAALRGGTRFGQGVRHQSICQHLVRVRRENLRAPCRNRDRGIPEGIAASADGKFIYVANWFDNVLMKIDAVSLKAAGRSNRKWPARLRRLHPQNALNSAGTKERMARGQTAVVRRLLSCSPRKETTGSQCLR